MLNYIEYFTDHLQLSHQVAIMLVAAFFIMQVIGELLDFKGKAVPAFMNIRKKLIEKSQQKKRQQETFEKAIKALEENKALFEENKKLLNEVHSHYDKDNIQKRDAWIAAVNRNQEESLRRWKELSEKLDKNNSDTLELKIESKRTAILSLAQRAVDPTTPLTHEEFRRVFRIHGEYQKIIEEEHLENGEVDIAFAVIEDAYRERLKSKGFLEDIRGYS